MSFDLNGLGVFTAVVDAGGFTAAARQLGVSKSWVSKQVSGLEAELGSRLLNRTTRKLSPTEAGLAFYDYATRIVGEAEAAERAVNDLAHAPRGRLRINAPMSFGCKCLGPAMAAFRAKYPDIDIDISLNDRLVDLVDEGFDVAIRIGKLESSSLIARRLCDVKLVLCASPDYLKTAPPLAVPEDVKRHECLVYSLSEKPADWTLMGKNGISSTVSVTPHVIANNGDILADMAIAGAGVTYVPDFVTWEMLQKGELVQALPNCPDAELTAYAVYPAVRHLAAKVRVFVDFLAEWFPRGAA